MRIGLQASGNRHISARKAPLGQMIQEARIVWAGWCWGSSHQDAARPEVKFGYIKKHFLTYLTGDGLDCRSRLLSVFRGFP